MPSDGFGPITFTTGAILTIIGVLFATGTFISLTANPSGHASGIALAISILTVGGGIVMLLVATTAPAEASDE